MFLIINLLSQKLIPHIKFNDFSILFMKKILFILLLISPATTFAQYLEVGGSVGGSNYLGELASNSSDFQFSETNLAAGGFLRFNLNHLLAVKLHGQFTKVSGDDANSSNRDILNRNLNFQSSIREVGLTGEFNILGFDPYAGSFSPYVFAGIAFYNFNPTTADSLNIALQPLGTEGQYNDDYPDRLPYELNQIAVPFGLGVKYAVTENLHLGLEVGARKLFTDYLDDVSLTYPDPESFDPLDPNTPLAVSLSNRTLAGGLLTGQGRGDTNANDWYFIANFTVSFNFIDSGTIGGRRGGRRNKIGCPTF